MKSLPPTPTLSRSLYAAAMDDFSSRTFGVCALARPAAAGRPQRHRLAMAVLLGLLYGGTPLGAAAQEGATQLKANRQTPTDGQVAADHQGYDRQQGAIQSLNDTGRHPLRSYSLAKAQCWLDVSFHEYTRNDRSAFPQLALEQSVAITGYLAAGGAIEGTDNPARRTPLVNDALRLREDLWSAAERLRGLPGWSCAERATACAEVELVHAGNEHRQQGWRHAKPYVQIAEDLITEAQAAELSCPKPVIEITPAAGPAVVPLPVPAPPPPPAPAAPPPPPPPPVVKETIVLSASVLFPFDKRSRNDLLPTGRAQIDDFVARLGRVYARVDGIELRGHTDRLGKPEYNQRLSQDRADAVKTHLEEKGVTAPITAVGLGPADPVVNCPGNRQTPQLTDCLQPNRRVEITITGVKR